MNGGGRYYRGPRREDPTPVDSPRLDAVDQVALEAARLRRHTAPEDETGRHSLPPRPPTYVARRADTPPPRVHRESEPEIVKQARQAKLLWPVVVVVVTIVGWTIGTVAWIEGRIDRARETADEVQRLRLEAQRERIERLERYVDELRRGGP